MVAIRVLQTVNPTRALTPAHAPITTIRRPHSHDARPPPPTVDNRASSKLFRDAALEETQEHGAQAQARSPKLPLLSHQSENWTGDESIQDAVLRMLVDKYKPLRSGPIRSADEKLKSSPPRVGNPTPTPPVPPPPPPVQNPPLQVDFQNERQFTKGDDGATLMTATVARSETRAGKYDMANVPLLPSIEGHQPWHTTFQVPSHASSSIKYGHIPIKPVSKRAPGPLSVLDEQARRKEREAKKRSEHAGRLSRAKESTLDYKLGLKMGGGGVQRRPNPVSLKGWASLVEDRIEKARLEGQFKNVKGRGRPLKELVEEKNPFIAREEFLMNRIVQKNGAAPPWVEIQGELETAVSAFREVLKQSWTRRAIRMLTISQPPALLPKLTSAEVSALRDSDWETRERAYHDTAIEEINSLVRKYNGMAPYSVRKPYYMRVAELEKAYRDSGEDILCGLAERMNTSRTRSSTGITGSDDDSFTPRSGEGQSWEPFRFWGAIRQWISGWRRGSVN